MSQTSSEIAKRFFDPAFILQVISLIVLAVFGFSKLDGRLTAAENRITTLEKQRIEDIRRQEDRLNRIDNNVQRIVQWQIEQGGRVND